MLHRMALRVLPSLSLAVTEDAVRKRKRLVMVVPGLVAFGLYRAAKYLLPLADPMILLTLSGTIAVVTSMLAYRVGRGASWRNVLHEDGTKMLAWMAGWIGFVYGVQLSLLVLALLWLVGYDYLKHPDGPAMMAIIIASTAVARDAFELGHVRKMALMGRPFPTFPNGVALRQLLGSRTMTVWPWIAVGLVLGSLGGAVGHVAEGMQASAVAQLSGVTLLGGAIALCSYFGGLKPQVPWATSLLETKPIELLKYWWWPGLAFASTYYCVAIGMVVFVLKQPGVPVPFGAGAGAIITAMMALYGYYLGYRRRIENEQGPVLTENLLRCPFVMGILGKSTGVGSHGSPAQASKGAT